MDQSQHVSYRVIIRRRSESDFGTCSIKASRLLLEFREQDSYANSDYDDTDDEDPATNPLAELASYPFSPVNSVTKQCYQLRQAADEQRLRTGEAPTILYRLTRMSPDEVGDRRI